MTISTTHPSTEHLDALADAPSVGRPLDSDEAELLALLREHPEEVCAHCHRPYWTPALMGRIAQLWERAEAERLAASEILPADLEADPAGDELDDEPSPTDRPAWEVAAIEAGRLA